MWRRQAFDVIVVGGGPAGSMAARSAAMGGVDVLLLEKDRIIGSPVRCGEAISDEGLRLFFEPRDKWITATVSKLRLISPSGKEIDLDLKEKGYILDRRIFDYDLAQFAAAEGAQIVTRVYVSGLLLNNGCVVGVKGEYEGEPFEIRAKIIIGADGVESRVGRWAGLKTQLKMKDMESCAQKTITGISIDDTRFDFYLSKKWAPGGYLWIFPKGKQTANVGLGVSGRYSKDKSAMRFLDEFLKEKFPNCSVICTTVGGVSSDKTLKKFITDGLMLAGDSAHMVNPMTGGGIVPAMRAGSLAGQTAAEAIHNGDVSVDFLGRYPEAWHRLGGKNHERFYRIKEVVNKLSDRDLEKIATAVEKIPKEQRTITRVFQKSIFQKPSLAYDVLKVFSGL